MVWYLEVSRVPIVLPPTESSIPNPLVTGFHKLSFLVVVIFSASTLSLAATEVSWSYYFGVLFLILTIYSLLISCCRPPYLISLIVAIVNVSICVLQYMYNI